MRNVLASMVSVILVLVGMGFVWSGAPDRLIPPPQRAISRTISSLEDALWAVEEIQAAETLEEAQDLAAQAEQDLRDALSELRDLELPNFWWTLGEGQGALYLAGKIVDERTGEPVPADVYANGILLAREVTEVGLLMWQTEHDPVYLTVKASGYHRWELRFRFHLSGLEIWRGDIRLKRDGG